MFTTDHNIPPSGAIIPFTPRQEESETPQTSTIMALVAVTILHEDGEAPEDKLIDLIEASYEAEVIEVVDALEELALPAEAARPLTLAACNDNEDDARS